MRDLLAAGANPNAVDKDGRTADWWVARTGRADILMRLIAGKADIHIADKDGATALTEASRMGEVRVARLLRSNGATGTTLRVPSGHLRSAAEASLSLIQEGAELWWRERSADRVIIPLPACRPHCLQSDT